MAASVHAAKPQAFYTYSSQPRTLHYGSYRNLAEADKPFYGNIMYDKRVVRGNTWALRKMAQEALQTELAEERKRQKIRRQELKKELEKKLFTSPVKARKGPRRAKKAPGKAVGAETGTKDGDQETVSSSAATKTLRVDRDVDVQTDTTGEPSNSVETQVEEGELHEVGSSATGDNISLLALSPSNHEDHTGGDGSQLDSLGRGIEEKRHAELLKLQELEDEAKQASARRQKLEAEKDKELAELEQLQSTVISARQERERLLSEGAQIEQEKSCLLIRTVAWKEVRDMIDRCLIHISEISVYEEDSGSKIVDNADMREMLIEGYSKDQIVDEVKNDFMPWLYDEVAEGVKKEMLSRYLYDNTMGEFVLQAG